MVEYSSWSTTCANNYDLQTNSCLQLGSLNGGTCFYMLVSAWNFLNLYFSMVVQPSSASAAPLRFVSLVHGVLCPFIQNIVVFVCPSVSHWWPLVDGCLLDFALLIQHSRLTLGPVFSLPWCLMLCMCFLSFCVIQKSVKSLAEW